MENEEVKALQDEYKFIVERDKKHKDIDHIVFEDGRQYKLQHPGFMKLHEMLTGTDNLNHMLFIEGLKIMFPENENSPTIDEDYCNENQKEGWFWSSLLRGLLLPD